MERAALSDQTNFADFCFDSPPESTIKTNKSDKPSKSNHYQITNLYWERLFGRADKHDRKRRSKRRRCIDLTQTHFCTLNRFQISIPANTKNHQTTNRITKQSPILRTDNNVVMRMSFRRNLVRRNHKSDENILSKPHFQSQKQKQHTNFYYRSNLRDANFCAI